MSAYARAQALAALLRKQHVDGDDLPDFRAEEEHAGKVEGLTAASAPDQCDEPGNKRDVDEEVEGRNRSAAGGCRATAPPGPPAARTIS